ncbi:glucuronyl hydrolase [Bacteroidia bacterium]|nr:glucuronyl hydrolase [Bacteroidia bacterium]GHU87740.1 glucuronyl hydrolase [Bacteroidia bacterium]
MLKQTGNPQGKYPRTINKEGILVFTSMYDWTPGFFPGTLWYLYELTGEDHWKAEAVKWTESLEPLKTFTGHHDLGFMMYCSYGNAYRLDPNEKYKEILVESANSLSTRFNPVTRTIKSWNYRKAWNDTIEWFYPVIIDNMMNLEMLFFASKVTGDKKYYDIAVSHANTTIKNHLRSDYSSYHVVDYDTISGTVKCQATCQGYSDNSTWARGQAWGIYGFTMMFRETGDSVYLNVAKKMTDWYLKTPNLPADKVPYWDFNAGQAGYEPEGTSKAKMITEKYRDASAAAVVASALFELGEFTKNEVYLKTAVDMVHTLSSPAYRAILGQSGNFILMHSVGSIPHGAEIDVPLVYADYYFIEALVRYKRMLDK